MSRPPKRSTTSAIAPAIRYVRIEDALEVPIVLAWLRTAQHPLVADFVAVAGRTRPRRQPT
jgi:hypothetical protein